MPDLIENRERRSALIDGIAPPKHDMRCTQADGRCINLHCPRCGEPVNAMGHHPSGRCVPTHTGKALDEGGADA